MTVDKFIKKFIILCQVVASLLVTISAIGQQNGTPPVISNTGAGSIKHPEGDLPTPVVSNVILEDSDNENMSLAIFQFGEGYDAALDELVFEATDNIRSVYDANTGSLYLLAFPAGSGVSINRMQAAMRSVAYTTSSDDPGKRKVNLNISVTDISGNRSAPVTKSVSTEPVNDAPKIASSETSPQQANINRNYQIYDNLIINDPDSRLLRQAIVQIEEGFNQDRLGLEGGSRGLDVNVEARTVTIRGEANLNTYRRVIEDITYRHDPFFFRQSGLRRISLQLTDAEGGTSNRLYRFFIVQPNSVPRINIPPSLNNIRVQTEESADYSFSTVLFRNAFNDLNGNNLNAITIESLPEHGQLFIGNQEINNQFIISNTLIPASQLAALRYVPNPLYNGEDEFQWNARDAEDFAANAVRVSITIEPVNQAPELTFPANADVEEDTPTVIAGINVNDPDLENLRVSLVTENGTLFLSENIIDRALVDFLNNTENGQQVIIFSAPAALAAYALSSLVYLPEENYNGNDAIEIDINDGQGGSVEGTINISVLLVNDAPELFNLETEPVTYTEGVDPVNVTTNLSLVDEENNLISEATVSITEGYFPEEDSLIFTTTEESISGTFEEGVLSLSGLATVTAYQSALRNVRFFNSSDNPAIDSRTISFSVTDEEGAQSETVSRTLNVAPVNDPPELVGLEENPLGYIPEGGAVQISESLIITDPDSETLQSATVAIDEEEFDDDEDLLTFTNTENITGSWDEDEGILSLTGKASLAEYQEAIRNVQYQNLDDEADDDDDNKIILIRVNDGEAESNRVERELVANQPPLIDSFERSTDEEQPLSFTATDFPFDDPDNFPNGNLYGLIITELPAKGVLTLNADTLTEEDLNQTFIDTEALEDLLYRPLTDSTGTDSFGWNASDSASFAQSAAQVTITINPLPDPPRPQDLVVEVTEDEVYRFSAAQFVENSIDPDGDNLALVIIRSVPAHGSLQLNNIALPPNSQLNLAELDNLLYIPDDNYTGEDTFNWAASDGENTSTEVASVLMNITNVNDAPIISSLTRAINEGEAYTFEASDFSQNYLDIESTPLSIVRIESLPAEGSLLLDGSAIAAGDEILLNNISNLVYQPSAAMAGGVVSFTWTASDGELFAESTAKVNIIIGVGVTDFSITVREDEAYSFTRLQFANNYGNPSGTLQSIRIEALPDNGILLLDGNNVNENQEISADALAQLSYLPDSNYFGEDSFSWNASVGNGFASQAAAVLVTVNPANDAPQISQIADLSLLAGIASKPVAFTISDLEAGIDELTISVFSSDNNLVPSDQIVINGSGGDRSLIITPSDNVQGSVTVTVIVSDGEQQTAMEFIVDIAPYAVSLETGETLEICTGESGSLPVTISGGQSPYNLQVTCEIGDCESTVSYAEGSLTFTPVATETYFVSLVDANGIRSNVDTIQVNVQECTNLALEIPTAFTPNGDQVNDTWEIGNIEYANSVQVEIYNRYGLQVFSSVDYQEPWDGLYENNLLPVGTYYYTINVGNGIQIYNGSVTILR